MSTTNHNVAIKCKNLSKSFRIYDNPKDRLKQAFFKDKRKYYRDFSANEDISFELGKGEVVGIVGRNGSGKSTLLQMICGTLSPTSGTIETQGRISALLELGSGFNPEFTGLENIYLNGSILGLTKKEIEKEMDNILTFANIGNFVYQPVKSYSSGMQVRLAFGIAINVKPEILIIDEALAVGDEKFQRKCYSKIEAIRKTGATILFVSHNAGSIISLCDRAILLENGQLLADGKPKDVIADYQKLLYASDNDTKIVIEEICQKYRNEKLIGASPAKKDIKQKVDIKAASIHHTGESYDPNMIPSSTVNYGNKGVQINNILITGLDGKIANKLIRGKSYIYQYLAVFTEDTNNIIFCMDFKTVSGVSLGGYTTNPTHKNSELQVKAGEQFIVKYQFACNLNPGTYFTNCGIMALRENEVTYVSRIIDSAMFQVLPIKDNLVTGNIDFQICANIEHSNITGKSI